MDRVILIELEDIHRIHSRNPLNPNGPTEYQFTPGERPPWLDDPDFFESEKRFYPGPYLLRVNDEGAWLSRDGDTWREAVQCQPYPCVETNMWRDYVALYADAMGVSRRSLLSRLYGMSRELRKTPDEWALWSKIYHWSEGSDLVWSGLHLHTQYEVRESVEKEIRYVSQ